jgi:polyisoprenyl-phosphate glycosyltransferase
MHNDLKSASDKPYQRRGEMPSSREGTILISIIVPVYNEQDSIAPFLEKILEILPKTGEEFELLFVNDGSSDNTFAVIKQAAIKENNIRIIDLSRNFGKEAALTAGLDLASGDVVIPIDVDLQDPPELILDFIAKWREGYDVVNGVRVDRSTDTALKRNSSKGFYRLFNRLSQTALPENVGDFRLMDRQVIEAIKRMPERNRFMKGIFAWVGFKTCEIPYVRPQRVAGTTSWNYWKLWNFALDGMFGYSTAPLRVWTYAGFLLALLSILYGMFIVVKTMVFGIDVPGYASLISVILFLSGIQIISLGVIGEYIGRIFLEVKKRPVYLIREVISDVQPGHDGSDKE